MNVVDSSGWLEYFADAPNANKFAPAIQNTADLIVPTLISLKSSSEYYSSAARQKPCKLLP